MAAPSYLYSLEFNESINVGYYTNDELNLAYPANASYFNNGESIPAGTYKIRYKTGCIQYLYSDYGNWKVNNVQQIDDPIGPETSQWEQITIGTDYDTQTGYKYTGEESEVGFVICFNPDGNIDTVGKKICTGTNNPFGTEALTITDNLSANEIIINHAGGPIAIYFHASVPSGEPSSSASNGDFGDAIIPDSPYTRPQFILIREEDPADYECGIDEILSSSSTSSSMIPSSSLTSVFHPKTFYTHFKRPSDGSFSLDVQIFNASVIKSAYIEFYYRGVNITPTPLNIPILINSDYTLINVPIPATTNIIPLLGDSNSSDNNRDETLKIDVTINPFIDQPSKILDWYIQVECPSCPVLNTFTTSYQLFGNKLTLTWNTLSDSLNGIIGGYDIYLANDVETLNNPNLRQSALYKFVPSTIDSTHTEIISLPPGYTYYIAIEAYSSCGSILSPSTEPYIKIEIPDLLINNFYARIYPVEDKLRTQIKLQWSQSDTNNLVQAFKIYRGHSYYDLNGVQHFDWKPYCKWKKTESIKDYNIIFDIRKDSYDSDFIVDHTSGDYDPDVSELPNVVGFTTDEIRRIFIKGEDPPPSSSLNLPETVYVTFKGRVGGILGTDSNSPFSALQQGTIILVDLTYPGASSGSGYTPTAYSSIAIPGGDNTANIHYSVGNDGKISSPFIDPLRAGYVGTGGNGYPPGDHFITVPGGDNNGVIHYRIGDRNIQQSGTFTLTKVQGSDNRYDYSWKSSGAVYGGLSLQHHIVLQYMQGDYWELDITDYEPWFDNRLQPSSAWQTEIGVGIQGIFNNYNLFSEINGARVTSVKVHRDDLGTHHELWFKIVGISNSFLNADSKYILIGSSFNHDLLMQYGKVSCLSTKVQYTPGQKSGYDSLPNDGEVDPVDPIHEFVDKFLTSELEVIWVNTNAELDASRTAIDLLGIDVDREPSGWIAFRNGNAVGRYNLQTGALRQSWVRTSENGSTIIGINPRGICINNYTGNAYVAGGARYTEGGGNQHITELIYDDTHTELQKYEHPPYTGTANIIGPNQSGFGMDYGSVRDKWNRIWICDSNTLVKAIQQSNGQIVYNHIGFPRTTGTNLLYGITSDKYGDIWVSGNYGNSEFIGRIPINYVDGSIPNNSWENIYIGRTGGNKGGISPDLPVGNKFNIWVGNWTGQIITIIRCIHGTQNNLNTVQPTTVATINIKSIFNGKGGVHGIAFTTDNDMIAVGFSSNIVLKIYQKEHNDSWPNGGNFRYNFKRVLGDKLTTVDDPDINGGIYFKVPKGVLLSDDTDVDNIGRTSYHPMWHKCYDAFDTNDSDNISNLNRYKAWKTLCNLIGSDTPGSILYSAIDVKPNGHYNNGYHYLSYKRYPLYDPPTNQFPSSDTIEGESRPLAIANGSSLSFPENSVKQKELLHNSLIYDPTESFYSNIYTTELISSDGVTYRIAVFRYGKINYEEFSSPYKWTSYIYSDFVGGLGTFSTGDYPLVKTSTEYPPVICKIVQ